jgi:hypothetical protein
MNLVFRIATRLRACAPQPRDFLPITGLEHLGLVFRRQIFTNAEEFNAALTQLTDPRFPNRGCQFIPYALTADDIAKMEATPAPEPVAVQEPAPPIEDEPPVDEPSDEPTDDTPESESSPAFILDGKSITLNGERVAGLFGEEKQLRVLAAHSDLRPSIEAWLQTLNLTDQ